MKTKLLMLSFVLLLISAKTFAQITTTGIAIQGIARDELNNAVTNKNISLKFTIHYTNTSNVDVPLTPVTANLTTDAFGVFSYLLDVSSIEHTTYFDNQLKLKIEQTSPVVALISDENFNFVPYAVSASNGVPTGSIMPYIGTTPPRGWALCDGSALPPSAVALKAMIGNNAPDLRGMFLRGAGTNSNGAYSGNAGPLLKNVQTDGIKSHALAVTDPGHIHAITDPGHTHTISTTDDDDSNGGSNDNAEGGAVYNTSGSSKTGITINNNSTGISVNYSGQSETRPINYGVNYIIKL
jgi:microcystin-dependent protein